MKTFEEACEATFMRRAETADDGEKIMTELAERQARFETMHDEIQNSEHVAVLIESLREVAIEGAPIEALLAAAFSHGVMVGIEMERRDDSIGATI